MLNTLFGIFINKLVDNLVRIVESKLDLQLKINRLGNEAEALQKEVDAARSDEERSAVLKKIHNLHKFTIN